MGEMTRELKEVHSEKGPWQGTLKPSEKWLYVLNNKLFTDVVFSVGYDEEEIECHKILLVINSPVFETMFEKRWNKEDGSLQKIPLPEEEPEIFKLLLEFVYSGRVSTDDIDKLISTLVLGKKYLCSQLNHKCIEMLKDALTVQNIMQIHQVAEMMEESELHKATEEYMLHNANSLFASGEITKMNKTDLCKLLKNDELNVVEIMLFNAVFSWSQSECVKNNRDPNDCVIVAEILRDIIPLIRFTNMSPEDFSLQVVPKNILPLEDTVTIFRFMTTPQEKRQEIAPELDLRFNTTKRSLSYFVYNLRRLKGHGFDFGLKWQNCCFQTDRDVRIISLGFFRAIEVDATLEVGVKMQNQDMTETLAELSETVKCSGSEDIFHVKFKVPVRIPKNVLHTISYIVKGKETFYKTVGESTITANCGAEGKVTFQFKEAVRDNDMDQVPEICFRL